jgi:uncharacterized protein YjbI with pentapeptide repeats
MKWLLRYLIFMLFILFVPLTSVAAPYKEQKTLAESGGDVLLRKESLEIEKLSQEIINLKLKNEQLIKHWRMLLSNPAFLTALGALLAVFVTAGKVIAENRRQKDLDREQRIKELREREAENKRRADQKFTSIVEDLGSENEAMQASACVSITTFLKPEYKSLHEQVFDIVLANLKIEHTEVVSRLLVGAFDKALHAKFENRKLGNEKRGGQSVEEKYRLDLSRANLVHANLSGIDLSNADLGYAQLHYASLKGTTLYRVRAYRADFKKAILSGANFNEARMQYAILHDACAHDSNFVASDLKHADLSGVEFQQSRMQSAHLENAIITGARFEGANLDDTYFYGATVDDQALKSITKANNWKKAHFDDDVMSKLEKVN